MLVAEGLLRKKERSVVSGERLIMNNIVVSGGTVAAGLLGFAFQALVTHRLRPGDYGAAFAVLTILGLVWLPASAATLAMAREASRDRAEGRTDRSAAVLKIGSRGLLIAGVVIAGMLAIAATWLGGFLQLPSGLLLAGAVGLPFGMALPLPLGALQGEQRFAALSLVITAQACLKLVFAVVLGLFLGPVGVVGGVSLGTAVIYVVARRVVRQVSVATHVRVEWRRIFGYLSYIVPSTVAVAVLLSSDVLLVKHFFTHQSAGEYAAVSALGRGIVWGAVGVAGVLFPKLIFHNTRGQSVTQLITVSLLLTGIGGLLGMAILSAWSRPILMTFAGGAYVNGAGYLSLYALGMILFGSAFVLITTHQSGDKAGFLLVLLPITLLEPALIVRFHGSITQVVQIVDGCMALLLVGLGAMSLFNRTRQRTK